MTMKIGNEENQKKKEKKDKKRVSQLGPLIKQKNTLLEIKHLG
jgi:hypothetical protein